MIKYVVFDLDGTLLDTLDTIQYYVNGTFENNEIPPLTRDECRRFVGNGSRTLIRRALASRGITDCPDFDKIHDEYVASYDVDPYYLTKIYDGIESLVASLRSRGIKLAVLSNKPDLTTRAAVKRFFGDSFDVVRGGMDGVPLKPAPDSALAILSELSATREECAYVGDSDVDVLTAKNFTPALSVTVLWGFRGEEELRAAGADTFARNADELYDIITHY